MQDIYVKDFKGTSDTTAQITVVNVNSPNTIIEPALFPEGGNKESELVVGTGTRPKAGQESVFTFKGLVKGKKYQVWLYNRSHRDGEICDDGEYTPDSCGYYGSTVTESGETLWVTFNGLAITPKLYGSVENKTKKVARFYVPVSNKVERCGKLYASVEGKTRLVSRFISPPLIETLTYMQDCANYPLAQLKEGMVVEKPYTLIDKRDNNEYTIALLKDGNIWMCENLRIGSNDKTMTLTYEDSDFGYSVPGAVSFPEFELPKGSATGFNGSNGASNLYIDPEYGGYYTWKCATAGSTISSGNAPYSILPNGWRLPTGGSGSGDFFALYDQYNTSTLIMATPVPNFVRAGCFISSQPQYHNSSGYYWSSTIYTSNSSYAYRLNVSNGTTVYYDNAGVKANGCSVRGICRGNGAA